ncbi:MAG TPA: cyclic nucleotide-binding domain-containing protein [Candidatus Limnocylindria bacterium]|nr:cyclic nucleotide-binding domain-containing protein [Candidatus Limnocylindria bacterium]
MAMSLADRLKAVPLFASLSRKQLNKLIDVGWVGTFKAGKVLCAEGRGGDDFFVILEGEAEATRGGRKIRTLKPGDYFGEVALLDNAHRTATVTALGPMRCFMLARSDFKAALYEEDIAVKLLATMASRLRAAEELNAD